MSTPLARSKRRHTALHVHHHRAAVPEAWPAADPSPNVPDAVVKVPDLTRRVPATTTSTSNGPLPAESTTSAAIPIAIGVVVPVTIALLILVILHRRHVKKLRREDANDPHQSLDFGMGPAGARKNQNGGKRPEMRGGDMSFEKSLRRGRGMSMDDMAMANPYILPPELHSSRESIHSMSRNVPSGDDPYRQATIYSPSGTSIHSPSSLRHHTGDDSSSVTGSSSRGYRQDSMNQNLLRHAQRMSRTGTPQGDPQLRSPLDNVANGLPANPRAGGLPSNPRDGRNPNVHDGSGPPAPAMEPQGAYANQDATDERHSHGYLGGFIHSGNPAEDPQINPQHQQYDFDHSVNSSSRENRKSPLSAAPMNVHGPESPNPSIPPSSSPNRRASPHANEEYQGPFEQPNPYEFNEIVVPPSPEPQHYPQHAEHFPHETGENTPFYTPTLGNEHQATSLGVSDVGFDSRRLSIMRPLPPDDPNDNPEQRANRIRSFYKEYFNDNEPTRAYQPEAGAYYEDYDQEYMGDGTVYDSTTNQFIVSQAPFAEPVTRRAMTPPPRGPPRFQGMAHHQHNNSNPGPMQQRGRAFSSASTGRLGPSGRGPAGRPLPPPTALRTLPTPHLLKEDAFALPIDFAPPTTYRDRQAGRPESPFSELRPYSPAVPVANPLISAFEEMPMMPSPHQLRKSGLFTALDFAPPPRFKNSDTGSDAGSIRSGRSTGSAMSAAQIHNIRAGAYRVSRIPKGLVGTRDELTESLKPTWKLGT